MTWRTKLRNASYKGVPFFVESSDFDSGKRLAVHEFPQRDKPYVEELGRKVRKFELTAWVAAHPRNQFDVWPERDALIAACEEEGEGTLVHPYYGEMVGFVETIKVAENAVEKGGMIEINLSFIENGEIDFRATNYRDTFGFASDLYNDVFGSVIDEFNSAFDLTGLSDISVADIYDVFTDTSSVLQSIGRFASGDLSSFEKAFTAIGLSNVSGLISNGRYMANELGTMYEQVSNIVKPSAARAKVGGAPDKIITAYNTLNSTYYAAEYAMRSAQKVTEQARKTVESVSLRGSPDLMSRFEVENLRKDVIITLDDVIFALSEIDGFDETRYALSRLKAAVIEHMTAEAENFGVLFYDSSKNEIPAIVLAYKHYGVLRDDAIVSRNRIPNPLFIKSNSNVELISDVFNTQ